MKRPREANLTRLLDALEFPPAALDRAEEFPQYPLGKDGTLPPDEGRYGALSAFMELQAGGWETNEPAT